MNQTLRTWPGVTGSETTISDPTNWVGTARNDSNQRETTRIGIQISKFDSVNGEQDKEESDVEWGNVSAVDHKYEHKNPREREGGRSKRETEREEESRKSLLEE